MRYPVRLLALSVAAAVLVPGAPALAASHGKTHSAKSHKVKKTKAKAKKSTGRVAAARLTDTVIDPGTSLFDPATTLDPGTSLDPGTTITDPGTTVTDPGTTVTDPGTTVTPPPTGNPAQQCRAERNDPGFAAAHGGLDFAHFYGTNHNLANAFGKCVSSHAHAKARGARA